jgi:hypothetical protein
MDWGSVELEITFDGSESAHSHIRTQASTANSTDTLICEMSDNNKTKMTLAGSFKGFRLNQQKNAAHIANVTFVCSGAPEFATWTTH